ncbi:MAG: hypothetical protein ABI763_15035 [Bacteroidota bacterium]
MKFRITLVCLVFSFHASFSQKSVKDSCISFTILGASFQYQVPGGDMAKRFGDNFNAGGFLNYKFSNNWLIGLDGYFLFADKIKENSILDNISTSDGFIIGESGEYAKVYLYERGFQFVLKAGKIFSVFAPNKNSGIMFTAGAGFLQHKIRIDVDKDDVPELTNDYKKGYDRLTNGLAITENLSYLYCSNKRLLNFSLGLEFTQAFTQNRRDYNFDQMKKDTQKRIDLLYGIKLCWFFPLYSHAATSFYYY